MKIYFSCSITGGRGEETIYQEMVKTMQDLGHEVPTAHLSSSLVMEMEKVVKPREIYERDMTWLEESDIVVAEVTTPSHGVGYEIAMAIQAGKPVLCCHKAEKKVSMILTGNTAPNLTLVAYQNIDELINRLTQYLISQEQRLLH